MIKDINLEKLFFHLYFDPYPYRKYRPYHKTDKERTSEQLERAYKNNIVWSKKLIILMIQSSYRTAKYLKNMTKVNKKQKGLDVWM